MIAALFAVFALGVAACGDDDDDGGGGAIEGTKLTIYSSLPQQGASGGQTKAIEEGAALALETKGGKVGKYTVEYKPLDDSLASTGAADEGKARQNARTAAADKTTIGYIGEYNSGISKVTIPILNRAGIPQISPANTYVGLTTNEPGSEPGEPDKYYPTGKRNYARVVPKDTIQGAALAKAAQDAGCKSIHIWNSKTTYSAGLARNLDMSAKKIGLEVQGNDGIDPKASNYRAVATKVRGTNPDLIYYGGITQNNAGKLVKDLRAVLGPNVKLMGPDGIYEQAFLDDAGDAAEGMYVTFGGVPPSKLAGKGAEWYRAYKGKFGGEPEAYAAYG